MEHRKSMRRHSALPMVVKVTRASRFLVTTPPKIASVGASQRSASCITMDRLSRCCEGRTRGPVSTE